MRLYIDGAWVESADGSTRPVLNPATGDAVGTVAWGTPADVARAAVAAREAFGRWRDVSPYERSKILRAAASLLRAGGAEIARRMTLEQGKPLGEAKAEVGVAADTIDWFAEEGRRTYGRIIPAREPGTQQMVVKVPVGPVAVLTPWNFPLNQAARKIAAALAAGCTVVAKPSEEAPGCVAELVRVFVEAGLPAGVLNLLFGDPAAISGALIAHPAIRKVSFTGSTAVGKSLAALAGQHMKRATMELGGHAPVLVFADADLDAAAKAMAVAKFRNAGQICIAPTRFVVEQSVYTPFMDRFVAEASTLRLGNGLDPATTMGPLANARRLQAMEAMVADAVDQGASVRTGGRRHGNAGYFFEPTVLGEVPLTARAMNEEPFGPLALMRSFENLDEAIGEANRLPYGLAAFAFTRSSDTIARLGARVEAGMLSVNANLLALPEVPFGGVKDSGYGSEGGSEAMEAYMATKLIKVSETVTP
ncbi:NAD-dependent succinate-semialdehyde dehydrogenase [Hyphomicrobiales bacterium BP6-180914]|uniref:NAD-dependent succinate-semialdehyde dehydrogenase n=1 Tax=Lichenifustis flavocetrariae TaxID=2949735 RepID=A0AA41YSL6_9HYPH|nr:NAD-dependent succinate-semialdehyde dehydrogenase [Lichenifustis flavocetrariae]MCW6507821.1 NAD-dependent succinate-semialdehyde dehydrogenase [Lichenifustis flavocetrariae]